MKAHQVKTTTAEAASGGYRKGVVITSVALFAFVLILYISFFFIMASRAA